MAPWRFMPLISTFLRLHRRSAHRAKLFAFTSLALIGLSLVWTRFIALAEPEAKTNEANVVAIVIKYANEWDPERDPLVTLENGVQMKSSHIDGIAIGNERYYYRLRYGFNYDPVSRGDAEKYAVVAVLDPDTQWEMEIYRLDRNPAALVKPIAPSTR